MATYQQRKTSVDPQSGMPLSTDEPAGSNLNVNQTGTSPDSSTVGIIIAVVVVLIGAILAFNYGWFGGRSSNMTQNSTTTTTEPAPADTTTSNTATTTQPSTGTTGTGTTTGTTGTGTSGTGTTTGTGTSGTGTSGTGTTTTQ
jgi:hypothetical protein